jgi:hypothetical protein
MGLHNVSDYSHSPHHECLVGWKVKEINIVPNLLENNIRAIAERLQFAMTLGFKMLVFHVKPCFITKI